MVATSHPNPVATYNKPMSIAEEVSNALTPVVDEAVKKLTAGVDDAIQKAVDRLHGIKISVEIDVPPRANPVE